jgi:hypothetical protein
MRYELAPRFFNTALLSSIQPAALGQNPAEAMRIAARCIANDARLYLPENERPPRLEPDKPHS